MRSTTLLLCVFLLTACADAPADEMSANITAPTTTFASAEPNKVFAAEITTTSATTNLSSSTPTPQPTPPYPVSLPAMMIDETINGNNLMLEQVLARNNAYTRYQISYFANGYSLSGIMNIPTGDGPFPLLILNHGYIDPAIYINGRGLKREQDFFARSGFAVIHPDYRNHAFSDKDPHATTNFRLGYTKDVIGAVLAAQSSELPELSSVDTNRVGMLGHSMGGGITQSILVVRPELVDAAVLYAPVSSNAFENLEQYFLDDNGRSDRVQAIYDAHGSPWENPYFWKEISPRAYFERIVAPVQIHIGTNDDSTPPQWSIDIEAALSQIGKPMELNVYQNERHEFGPQWQTFMERSAKFFRDNLTTSSAENRAAASL